MERFTGPRIYTNPPTQESAPEGPNLLVVVREVTEIQKRAEQVPLFLLGPSPTYSIRLQLEVYPALVNT